MTPPTPSLETIRCLAGQLSSSSLPEITEQTKLTDLDVHSLLDLVGAFEHALHIVVPDEKLVDLVTIADLLAFAKSAAPAALTDEQKRVASFNFDLEEPELHTELHGSTLRVAFLGMAGSETSFDACIALVSRVVADAPRSLELYCESGHPARSWEIAIAGVTFPSVESFTFDADSLPRAERSTCTIGDLSAVLHACPNLERALVGGDVSLTRADHRALRALELRGARLRPETATALEQARLPELEALTISFVESEREQFEKCLALNAPKLSSVRIDDIEDVPELVARLARRGVPSQWKTLSIGGDPDVEYLAIVLGEHPDAFKSLDSLVLDLSEEQAASLRMRFPMVKASATLAGQLMSPGLKGIAVTRLAQREMAA